MSLKESAVHIEQMRGAVKCGTTSFQKTTKTNTRVGRENYTKIDLFKTETQLCSEELLTVQILQTEIALRCQIQKNNYSVSFL